MGNISSSCSEKARETRDFILRDFLPNYKNILMEVSENSIEAGDMVLFNMQSTSNALLSFKHAVVYCGDGDVIHFQNTGNSSEGRISKEGFWLMRQQRGKGKVLRKNEGINLETFNRKVRELMNSTAMYNLFKNNCINFALYLLDLGHFSFQSTNSHEEELESLTVNTFGVTAPCVLESPRRVMALKDPASQKRVGSPGDLDAWGGLSSPRRVRSPRGLGSTRQAGSLEELHSQKRAVSPLMVQSPRMVGFPSEGSAPSRFGFPRRAASSAVVQVPQNNCVHQEGLEALGAISQLSQAQRNVIV